MKVKCRLYQTKQNLAGLTGEPSWLWFVTELALFRTCRCTWNTNKARADLEGWNPRYNNFVWCGFVLLACPWMPCSRTGRNIYVDQLSVPIPTRSGWVSARRVASPNFMEDVWSHAYIGLECWSVQCKPTSEWWLTESCIWNFKGKGSKKLKICKKIPRGKKATPLKMYFTQHNFR